MSFNFKNVNPSLYGNTVYCIWKKYEAFLPKNKMYLLASVFLKKYLFGYVNILFQILNQKVSVENLRETLYPVLGVTL